MKHTGITVPIHEYENLREVTMKNIFLVMVSFADSYCGT